MGLSPATMASVWQNGTQIEAICLLVQGCLQHSSLSGLQSRTGGGAGGGGGGGSRVYDASVTCTLSAPSTILSNTKEAWAWQTFLRLIIFLHQLENNIKTIVLSNGKMPPNHLEAKTSIYTNTLRK